MTTLPVEFSPRPQAHDVRLRAEGGVVRAGAKAEAANVEFQALFLTQVVEQMLPDDAESVYGAGTGGPIWRSMLAEKIAAQLAERDVLGLANVLERRASGAAVTPPAESVKS